MHVHISACQFTHKTRLGWISLSSLSLSACMCACVRACMRARACVCMCMRARAPNYKSSSAILWSLCSNTLFQETRVSMRQSTIKETWSWIFKSLTWRTFISVIIFHISYLSAFSQRLEEPANCDFSHSRPSAKSINELFHWFAIWWYPFCLWKKLIIYSHRAPIFTCLTWCWIQPVCMYPTYWAFARSYNIVSSPALRSLRRG